MPRLALALLLLLFALPSFAQQSFHVSPIATFDFGSPLFINRAAGVFDRSTIPDTGVSKAFSYGLGVQAAVGLIGPIGLVGAISGQYTLGQFGSSRPGGDTISGHEWKLSAEALVAWEPSMVSLRAGPWASERLAGTIFSNTSVSASSALSYPFHFGLTAGLAWQIANLPVKMELKARLDLRELSAAGANAWSYGSSIAYDWDWNKSTNATQLVPSPKVGGLKPAHQSGDRLKPVLPRVTFLVNGSEARGNPPLDREEKYVTEYSMVEAPNASPTVAKWIDNSYHLPHLSIACTSANGSLIILSGQRRLLYRTLAADSSQSITIVNLDEDTAWHHALLGLKSTDSNQLIAELAIDSKLALDTLMLPPADSTHSENLLEKHEFRFRLSQKYAQYAGGRLVLDLLFRRMQSILAQHPNISVFTQTGAGSALLERLREVLGNSWDGTMQPENLDSYVTVLFEY